VDHVTTVRYWAGLRAAAGVAEEQAVGPTVRAVLEAVRARHDARFAEVLEACSLLLDGAQVHDQQVAVGSGSLLDCLPPYAGG
jgi:molybdopterin converting factor small subunit